MERSIGSSEMGSKMKREKSKGSIERIMIAIFNKYKCLNYSIH